MKRRKQEYSKFLLLQESLLIWIMSLNFLILAFYCIYKGFTGTLPWLTAMIGFPWTAYGVSQVFYYKKSLAENTKNGIKYESVLADLNKAMNNYTNNSTSSNLTEEPFSEEELIENPDDYQI